MNGKYKTVTRVFFAWNYLAEIESLNKASEEGWQLVKGGCFNSRFAEDHSIQYRYQMDFQKVDDMARYIEMFREQGWEYINSTFNNWHYFRKIYDPSLPEEAYEIFTDRESINEMTGRFSHLATAFSIILGLGAVVYAVDMFRKPKLPTLIMLATLLIECAVLLSGALLIRRPRLNSGIKGDTSLFALFMAVIIIGAVGSAVLKVSRPYLTTEQSAASMDHPQTDEVCCTFDIKYKDNYFIDLDLEGDAPVTVKIIDEDGRVVFIGSGTDLHLDDFGQKLSRGTYRITCSASSGYHMKTSIE